MIMGCMSLPAFAVVGDVTVTLVPLEGSGTTLPAKVVFSLVEDEYKTYCTGGKTDEGNYIVNFGKSGEYCVDFGNSSFLSGVDGEDLVITINDTTPITLWETTDSDNTKCWTTVAPTVTTTYVAEIGSTQYETLAAAVADVPADGTETTITMIGDYEAPMDHADSSSGGYNIVNIAKDQNVILDLNGKTITGVLTYDAKNSAVITVSEYGTLTIRDTSAAKTGTITHVKYDDSVRVGNWAADNWQTDILFNHGGTLTIEGGTIANTANGNICYAIDTSNNYRHNNATLTITGGTITSQNCDTIRMRLDAPVYGEASGRNIVNISGGSISGKGGLWAQVSSGDAPKGRLSITGGSITGGDWGALSFSPKNGGVSIDDFPASISGGKIEGSVGLPHQQYISGGVFSEEIAVASIAEGYEAVGNTDSETSATYPYTVGIAATYVAQIGETKYETLAAAIEAAESSAIIEILGGTWDAEAIGTVNNWDQIRNKSLTIQPASDASVTFTSDVSLGVDNSTTVDASITVKNIDFNGASLAIKGYLNATVDRCSFSNASSGSATLYIIDSCCKNLSSYPSTAAVTVTDCTINGSPAGAPGIRLRDSGNVTLTNNNISNTSHNGITFESNSTHYTTPAKTITVTGNTITEWNVGNANGGGRGMRLALGGLESGSTVTINDNYFTKQNVSLDTPDFVKITGAEDVSVDLSHNYWNGESRSTVRDNDAYYTSDGGTTLDSVICYVAQIGDVKYETLAAAIAAANESGNCTITLLKDYDMEANEPGYGYTTSFLVEGENEARNNMLVFSANNITFDLGGHTLSNLFNNTFSVTGSNVTIKNGEMRVGELYYSSLDGTKVYTSDNDKTCSYIVYVTGAQNFVVDNLTTYGGINVSGGSTATINDLSFSGTKFYAVCSQTNSTVTLNGGTYNKAIFGATGNLFWVEAGSTMDIMGGSFTKGTANFANGNTHPTIYGGTFDFNPTADVAEGYAATDNGNGTWTVSSAVAQIGNVQYATLQAAFNAAQNGDTITLLADLTQDNGVIFNKADATVKLDLNDKTFTVNEGSNCNNRAIRIDNGTLEVYNGSIVAKGSGTTSSNGAGCYGAFRVEANGKLIAHDLTLENSRPWGLNVKVLGGEAELTRVTINSSYGGGIEVTEKTLGGKTKTGKAVLTDCTFNQSNHYDHCSTALSVSGGSELIVNSGSYTGEYALYVFSSGGVITVNGGTFTGLGKEDRAAIVAEIDLKTYPEYTGGLNISGGNFTGDYRITSPAYLSITGGTFSVDPSNYVVPGYKAVENDDTNTKDIYPHKVVKATGTVAKVNEENNDDNKLTIPQGIADVVHGTNDTTSITTGTDTTIVGSVTIEGGSTIEKTNTNPAEAGSDNNKVTVQEVEIKKNAESTTVYAVTTNEGTTLANATVGNGMDHNKKASEYVPSVAQKLAEAVADSKETIDSNVEVDLDLNVVATANTGAQEGDVLASYNVNLKATTTVIKDGATTTTTANVPNNEIAKDAKFTFKLDVEGVNAGEHVKVLHYKEDNSTVDETLFGIVDTNNQVEITVSHFSKFEVKNANEQQINISPSETVQKPILVTLDLDDSISIVFMIHKDVTIPEEATYQLFLQGRGNATYTAKGNVTDAEMYEGTYRMFKLAVPAQYIVDKSDKVALSFYVGNEVIPFYDGTSLTANYQVSVADYLNAMKGEDSGNLDELEVLARSLLDYGALAKQYLANQNGTNQIKSFNGNFSNISQSDFDYYAATRSGSIDGLSYYGASVSLLSQMRVNLFFRLNGITKKQAEEIPFYVGGSDQPTYATVQSNGKFAVLTLPGVSPNRLADKIKVTSGDFKMEYSVFSYARTLAQSKDKDSNAAYLLRAIANYQSAAEAYVAYVASSNS